MKWFKVIDRMLPPCQTVLVARTKNNRRIVEQYYVSTHPVECVEDDKITHWQWMPGLPECEG
jgi:hypothetical protein